MLQSTPPSIHTLRPLEKGGTISRGGFIYQDHIAVGFYLELLLDESLEEVWCETHDDITLIWRSENGQEVEFVQVKNITLDHFWSVSELCKRDKSNGNPSGSGTSLLEKSLAHDRCLEPCRFRIITSLPTHVLLKSLHYPLTSPERDITNKQFNKLCDEVEKKCNGVVSPNGHDIKFWLKYARWTVESSVQDIIPKNIAKLTQIIEDSGSYLPSKVIEERIYPQLLGKAQETAIAEWEIDPEAKKVKRNQLIQWLDDIIKDVQAPISGGAGEQLRAKMKKASITDDYIIGALDERQKYRKERLHQQYLDVSDLELIDGEVLAELKNLLLKLDSGELPEGIPFFKACREKLQDLQISLNTKSKPPLFYLDGCMYEIADRCAHRYHREAI